MTLDLWRWRVLKWAGCGEVVQVGSDCRGAGEVVDDVDVDVEHGGASKLELRIRTHFSNERLGVIGPVVCSFTI